MRDFCLFFTRQPGVISKLGYNRLVPKNFTKVAKMSMRQD